MRAPGRRPARPLRAPPRWGRRRAAEEGILELKQAVDTVLVIPNERLHMICEEEITAENAFKMADNVLRLGVQSIAELVTTAGEINLDFADVEAVMRDAGPACLSRHRPRS